MQKDFCQWLFSKDVIMRGAKVLTLSMPMFKIKFIDSLSIIPMKLANSPKIFCLIELAKGYFPHLFNKKENEHYIGPLPPSPYYHPDGMSRILSMCTANHPIVLWSLELQRKI
jgi:hypothetical protein